VRSSYRVCFAGAGLCTFGYVRYGNPALPLALVFVVLFAALIVWGERRGVRQGLYESELGLTVVNLYTSYPLLWADVAGFDHRRTGTWDRVYAKRSDGRVRAVATVLQGQRVVWDDGETRDIVGVLNQRLAEVRGVSQVAP
jgi:hypothetical protein